MLESIDWIDDVLMAAGLLLALLTGDLLIGGGLFALGAVLHALLHGMI